MFNMKISLKPIITLIFCLFFATLSAQQTNYKESFYKLFINGNVSKWDKLITQLEEDA